MTGQALDQIPHDQKHLDQFPAGASVTVTFTTADGTVRTWQAISAGLSAVRTFEGNDWNGKPTFMHEQGLLSSANEDRPVWFHVRPPFPGEARLGQFQVGPADRFGRAPDSDVSRTHLILPRTIGFQVGAAGWTVTAQNEQDKQVVQAATPPRVRRDALLARFATIDPDASAELSSLVNDLVSQVESARSYRDSRF